MTLATVIAVIIRNAVNKESRIKSTNKILNKTRGMKVEKKVEIMLSEEDMIVDDLGRLVIKNPELLDHIRGALGQVSESGMLGDSGNCGCTNNTQC
jgi:hypothetical protein